MNFKSKASSSLSIIKSQAYFFSQDTPPAKFLHDQFHDFSWRYPSTYISLCSFIHLNSYALKIFPIPKVPIEILFILWKPYQMPPSPRSLPEKKSISALTTLSSTILYISIHLCKFMYHRYQSQKFNSQYFCKRIQILMWVYVNVEWILKGFYQIWAWPRFFSPEFMKV